MMGGTRLAETYSDGRAYCRAVAGPFEVTRLRFPPGYRHGRVEPERGYLVAVLEGAVTKSFPRDGTTLARGSVALVPAGAAHSSSFAGGAEVLSVRAAEEGGAPAFGSLLARRRQARASASTALAWRIAGELETRDASADLAIEGLVLQLLATAGRASTDPPRGASSWLRAARDLLHERTPGQPSLGELGEAVGRHPTHVARAFRREYGMTVTEYARSLRLEWARTQLALEDVPLARLAADAGFADQSHFTRAFRLHTGLTPGRYRQLAQGCAEG
jgi:AraC family transcriptional regulator